jgi:gliding motility-associated-like protein
MATGAGPAYQWFWSPQGGLNQHNQQCVDGQPPYSTHYFLVVESNGCTSPADSVLVSVMPRPAVDAGNIRNICEGDSVRLNGIVQQGIATGYQWVPAVGLNFANILQPEASPTVSAWYYFRAWNAMCPGDFDSVQVVVHDRPQSIAGTDTSICLGEGIQLQGNYTGGSIPVQFQWSPATGLSGQNTLQPIASPTVSTLYYLEVSSGTGNTSCNSIDSIMVIVQPKPIALITRDTQVICAGAFLQLEGSGGQGSASYTWSDGQSSIGTTPMIQVKPLQHTTYLLYVQEGACRDTAMVPIFVHPAPEADFIISQPDACVSGEIKTQNLSSHGGSYTWHFGDGGSISNETNPSHAYASPGTYTVSLIVTGLGGCKDTMRSPIPVQIRPGMDFRVISNPEVPAEFVLPVQAFHWQGISRHTAEYFWDFGDGGMATGEQVSYTYRLPGTYYVRAEAKDSSGCIERVQLGPYRLLAPELEIPNVFTPNGDGIHDLFLVPYVGDELFKLSVLDRWGTLMYTSHNKAQGWDGRDLNGQQAPEGTYFYRVDAGSGSYSGYVVLMR